MALYDLPDTVDYIKKYTKVDKISGYIGHSQGTIQMFARLCMTPEFAENLNIFVGLAPVAFGGHIPNHSPAIAFAIKYKDILFNVFKDLGWNNFLYMGHN